MDYQICMNTLVEIQSYITTFHLTSSKDLGGGGGGIELKEPGIVQV